jgi:hypothetical protein
MSLKDGAAYLGIGKNAMRQYVAAGQIAVVVFPGRNVETEILKISTTPAVRSQLEELTGSGWYGKTANEVVATLIGRGLEQLAKEGILSMPKGPKRRELHT